MSVVLHTDVDFGFDCFESNNIDAIKVSFNIVGLNLILEASFFKKHINTTVNLKNKLLNFTTLKICALKCTKIEVPV